MLFIPYSIIYTVYKRYKNWLKAILAGENTSVRILATTVYKYTYVLLLKDTPFRKTCILIFIRGLDLVCF